jgi:hypothetical protein
MTDAWKWQLRDRLGQWMNMDSEVRWLSSGQSRQGHIVGSPSPGVATVEENGGLNVVRRVNVPTSRLTAITLPPGKTRPPTKPDVPEIPESLASLNDKRVQDLYWATRDNPSVPLKKWLRIAMEVFRRKIDLDPHMGGGALTPEGVFAAGTPTSHDAIVRQMRIRITERTLALR